MDPQQRLLLELSCEVLENAAIKASTLRGSASGVFIGIASADYSYRFADDLSSMSHHFRRATPPASRPTDFPTCMTYAVPPWRSIPPAPRRWSPFVRPEGRSHQEKVPRRLSEASASACTRTDSPPSAKHRCSPAAGDATFLTLRAMAMSDPKARDYFFPRIMTSR